MPPCTSTARWVSTSGENFRVWTFPNSGTSRAFPGPEKAPRNSRFKVPIPTSGLRPRSLCATLNFRGFPRSHSRKDHLCRLGPLLPVPHGAKGKTQYSAQANLNFKDPRAKGLWVKGRVDFPAGRTEDLVDLIDKTHSNRGLLPGLSGSAIGGFSFDAPGKRFEGKLQLAFEDTRFLNRRLGDGSLLLRVVDGEAIVVETLNLTSPYSAIKGEESLHLQWTDRFSSARRRTESPGNGGPRGGVQTGDQGPAGMERQNSGRLQHASDSGLSDLPADSIRQSAPRGQPFGRPIGGKGSPDLGPSIRWCQGEHEGQAQRSHSLRDHLQPFPAGDPAPASRGRHFPRRLRNSERKHHRFGKFQRFRFPQSQCAPGKAKPDPRRFQRTQRRYRRTGLLLGEVPRGSLSVQRAQHRAPGRRGGRKKADGSPCCHGALDMRLLESFFPIWSGRRERWS